MPLLPEAILRLALPLALASEGGRFNPVDPASWPNFLWTIVIFFVALPLMWKFVFGPIVRALDAREDRTRKAAAEAEGARDEARKAEAACQARLAEASREVAAILGRGREQAERETKDLLDRAEADAAARKGRALGEIEAARSRALEEIRREVVDLSLAAASEVLRRRLDAADDRRLVEEALAKAAPAARAKQ